MYNSFSKNRVQCIGKNYYDSSTVRVAWSFMASQSQLISQVGINHLQCLIREFISKKLGAFFLCFISLSFFRILRNILLQIRKKKV